MNYLVKSFICIEMLTSKAYFFNSFLERSAGPAINGAESTGAGSGL